MKRGFPWSSAHGPRTYSKSSTYIYTRTLSLFLSFSLLLITYTLTHIRKTLPNRREIPIYTHTYTHTHTHALSLSLSFSRLFLNPKGRVVPRAGGAHIPRQNLRGTDQGAGGSANFACPPHADRRGSVRKRTAWASSTGSSRPSDSLANIYD